MLLGLHGTAVGVATRMWTKLECVEGCLVVHSHAWLSITTCERLRTRIIGSHLSVSAMTALAGPRFLVSMLSI